jgi:hypothetical protein
MMSNHTTEVIDEAIRVNGKYITSTGIRKALIDVLVKGHSRREAAIKNKVTESGICRAMKRLGLPKSNA